MHPEHPTSPSPFHAGERAVQLRAGVREQIEPWARRVIRPYLPPQHQAFYSALPYIVVAARDARGQAWVTLLCGEPGFASAPDARRLHLAAQPVAGDALAGAFVAGADVGILGIELHTRRRNRVNGRVLAPDAGEWAGERGLTLAVDQSFGNCPQYIHAREGRRVVQAGSPPPVRRSSALSLAQREHIRRADTAFIASGHRGVGEDPAFGMDASHRGGAPGFVRVDDAHELVLPDYAGNNHFNTVGNIVVDARVGLLFVDFATGGLLQLTGRAEIDDTSAELASFAGARRLIRFHVEGVVELPEALPLRWGDEGEALRDLRLVKRERESADVCSFYFAARDGGALPGFEAGQHLPLELAMSDSSQETRSYSLSNAPNAEFYRISVKREPQGLISPLLHDTLELGAILAARPPAGDFVLEHGARPVVLISAGVGVTPMLSMLHELVARDEARPVTFIHAARDGEHHPFRAELRLLSEAREQISTHVAYSRPRSEDQRGRDYDSEGRLDAERIVGLLPSLDVDVYLCGPLSFMAGLHEGLADLGIAPARIHTESFGPS